MYCNFCGKEIHDGAKYCEHCGKEVKKEKKKIRPKTLAVGILCIAVLALATMILTDVIQLPMIGSKKRNGFEDPEFMQFLSVMFNKEPESITEDDLLSITFFGYCEGDPVAPSKLKNYGLDGYTLYENYIYFNTVEVPNDLPVLDAMFGLPDDQNRPYRESCSKMTVIGNEWMAEHVMPYLYQFKNLKVVLFGYCWISDDLNLPRKAEMYKVNTHAKDFHDPYENGASALSEAPEDDLVQFEDSDFELFLCTMFDKDVGTITRRDLKSVKFFGYYEGDPVRASKLENYGSSARRLAENMVYYSTENVIDDDELESIMFGDSGDASFEYGQRCIKVSVPGNMWMAEHVMPYLYYFEDLQGVLFGYCWVTDAKRLPNGARCMNVNIHAEDFHQPYEGGLSLSDTRYDDENYDSPMQFEDSEFERFLCTMFQKEPGTISQSDLKAVRFFGYYEGDPHEASTLENLGSSYQGLEENMVYFSTEDLQKGTELETIMFSSMGDSAKDYGDACTKMTVPGNEWMAEHVMPYLYYFEDLQGVVFGYCWVSENVNLPDGVSRMNVNTHGRDFHQPYEN